MEGILFANVNVLDCTGAEPYSGEVLIEGNRISAVAKGDRKVPCNRAHFTNDHGAMLLPGLTEAHTHLSFVNKPDFEKVRLIPPESRGRCYGHCYLVS